MRIRKFAQTDAQRIVELWRRCGLVVPQNDPHKDIERKMSYAPGQFLVGEIEGEIVASAMFGYDGHRGSVNYLAIAPEHRHLGLGKLMMQHIEETLKGLGCPKINLDVRSTNTAVVAFYEHIGFRQDPTVPMGKRLIDDSVPFE